MADVRLEGVSKSYGTIQILHNINVAIDHGEFVVFVGPSGSGKSTLLRMIAGLERINAGHLLIDHKVVNTSMRLTAISVWCFRAMRSIRT